MKLAIFDLDNTLLAGDSDHAWGQFLVAKKLVDPVTHAQRNDQFYKKYMQGNLDIHEYVNFTLGPVLNYPVTSLQQLHLEFMAEFITPMLLPAAEKLIQHHRNRGDYCLIMSATNSFITHPIAEVLEVDDILSTDLVMEKGFYTGEILGEPCFQEGKVNRLSQWLSESDQTFQLKDATFYSDSHNDLPLLQSVGIPVAVDADEKLSEIAKQQRWKTISLRINPE